MSTLAASLGIDLESPSQRRALALTEIDADLLRDLIEVRICRGLTQQDVADRLGISQAAVAAFERDGNDPKLSTIRRYAHAVEAIVQHAVEAHDPEVWQEHRVTRMHFARASPTRILDDWAS